MDSLCNQSKSVTLKQVTRMSLKSLYIIDFVICLMLVKEIHYSNALLENIWPVATSNFALMEYLCLVIGQQ